MWLLFLSQMTNPRIPKISRECFPIFNLELRIFRHQILLYHSAQIRKRQGVYFYKIRIFLKLNINTQSELTMRAVLRFCIIHFEKAQVQL